MNKMIIIAENNDRWKSIEKNSKKKVKCAATQQNVLAKTIDVNILWAIFCHIVVENSLPVYIHSQDITNFDMNNGFILCTDFKSRCSL